MGIKLAAGGILGFSARDVISDTINVCTFALPGYGVHHLGIIGRHAHDSRLLLYESTSSERPPCIYTGEKNVGVGARTLADTIDFCDARGVKLWYYGLRAPLYSDESDRLAAFLYDKIGISYDMDGTLHAGGGLLYQALSIALRGEDLFAFFCSEICMAALVNIGRVQTNNVSKWSPNSSVRFLVKAGICDRPILVSPALLPAY